MAPNMQFQQDSKSLPLSTISSDLGHSSPTADPTLSPQPVGDATIYASATLPPPCRAIRRPHWLSQQQEEELVPLPAELSWRPTSSALPLLPLLPDSQDGKENSSAVINLQPRPSVAMPAGQHWDRFSG